MRRPGPAATTILLVAASVALGLLAARFETFPGDDAISAWARALGPRFEPVATVFNEYDLAIYLGLLVAAAVILRWRGDREAFGVTVLMALTRPALGEPKEWVGRPRPEGDFAVLDVVDTASFPSGHVMTAATAFGVWLLYAPLLVPPRWGGPSGRPPCSGSC